MRVLEAALVQVQWPKGDIALGLKPVYGEQTLGTFAQTVGVEYEQLRQYRQVAEAFKMPTRVGNLSWSHHRIIARTVGYHVGNILNKTTSSNRTEAATYAGRIELV